MSSTQCIFAQVIYSPAYTWPRRIPLVAESATGKVQAVAGEDMRTSSIQVRHFNQVGASHGQMGLCTVSGAWTRLTYSPLVSAKESQSTAALETLHASISRCSPCKSHHDWTAARNDCCRHAAGVSSGCFSCRTPTHDWRRQELMCLLSHDPLVQRSIMGRWQDAYMYHRSW